jgi:hypothetical protein
MSHSKEGKMFDMAVNIGHSSPETLSLTEATQGHYDNP